MSAILILANASDVLGISISRVYGANYPHLRIGELRLEYAMLEAFAVYAPKSSFD